jgi:WD40 repeat protein
MSAVAFAPDGKTLAIAAGDAFSNAADDTIRFWDTASGNGPRVFTEHGGGIYYLSFSPDGKTLATGNLGIPLTVWDTSTGNAVTMSQAKPRLIGRTLSPCWNAISPDGKVLAHIGDNTSFSFSEDPPSSSICLADISNEYHDLRNSRGGRWSILRILTGHAYIVRAEAFSPDGKTFASGDSHGIIKLWDVATGRDLRTLAGHAGGINCIAFSTDGKTLASASDDDTVKLWDRASGKELGGIYLFGENDWTVIAPDGRFDTSNLDDIQGIHWVMPDQPFTPVPVESFYAQYYTPGLLDRLLHRVAMADLPDITTINHIQPIVVIDSVTPHPGGDPALVDVKVSFRSQSVDVVRPDGGTSQQTSGVYDLRLFRNGKIVASLSGDAAPGEARADLSHGKTNEVLTHTFVGIRLSHDGAKSAVFTAYAYNGGKVKSLTASFDYATSTPLPAVKGRAWVVAFGVNSYEDPQWNLRFAAADAHGYGEYLAPRLRETGQYSGVTFVPLISDIGAAASETLPATKEVLRSVLAALAGKPRGASPGPFAAMLDKLGVHEAAPEDMVLLAFSCHGDTDTKTGEYYLLPSDIGPEQDHGLTPALEGHAISSAELSLWLQDVDAGEMAMVIDSCRSAAAAGPGFKPGPMDSAGLGQLAYYKRMRILSASQANAAAKEYRDLGHGLLTSALLADGLVNGQARPEAGQAMLTLGPWLDFAAEDVPLLDARERGVKAPARKGIEMVDDSPSATDVGLQKPSLFDFHRAGERDAAISIAGAMHDH